MTVRPVSRGEAHYRAVLDPSKVREIRLAVASGIAKAAIARRFNVNPSTVRDIHQGRTWRHVP